MLAKLIDPRRLVRSTGIVVSECIIEQRRSQIQDHLERAQSNLNFLGSYVEPKHRLRPIECVGKYPHYYKDPCTDM